MNFLLFVRRLIIDVNIKLGLIKIGRNLTIAMAMVKFGKTVGM